jgi:hypothetical protein
MTHLELGSDATNLRSKARAIRNAKEAEEEEEERRNFGLEVAQPSEPRKKPEPEPVVPEVTYEPENIIDDPQYDKFLETHNDTIVKKIDALGGKENYIKALQKLYKEARDIEKTKVPYHYAETFHKQSNENMTLQSNDLLVPLYGNISYKKTRDDWYRRLLGYIEAMKQAEVSGEPVARKPNRLKKISINGQPHYFKEGSINGSNALIVYDISDSTLEEPIGYIKWDMEKKKPSGKLLPMP